MSDNDRTTEPSRQDEQLSGSPPPQAEERLAESIDWLFDQPLELLQSLQDTSPLETEERQSGEELKEALAFAHWLIDPDLSQEEKALQFARQMDTEFGRWLTDPISRHEKEKEQEEAQRRQHRGLDQPITNTRNRSQHRTGVWTRIRVT